MSEAAIELVETPMPEALTRRVASWIAGLRHENLPETTRQAVRLAVLDTLGAGLDAGCECRGGRQPLDILLRGTT